MEWGGGGNQERQLSDWGVAGFLESVSSPFPVPIQLYFLSTCVLSGVELGADRGIGLMGALPSGSSVPGDMGSFRSFLV